MNELTIYGKFTLPYLVKLPLFFTVWFYPNFLNCKKKEMKAFPTHQKKIQTVFFIHRRFDCDLQILVLKLG